MPIILNNSGQPSDAFFGDYVLAQKVANAWDPLKKSLLEFIEELNQHLVSRRRMAAFVEPPHSDLIVELFSVTFEDKHPTPATADKCAYRVQPNGNIRIAVTASGRKGKRFNLSVFDATSVDVKNALMDFVEATSK